ncbi:MAG: hypothetical protein CVV64_01365 [Candidatus Wallbacteria bacterium HGW-Wallbacteria-1]|jgi:hypothetical protein|uniref:Type 4 fimbrial biogenesis protein PilX N-terminal domain-containing protein n=1 Tax=Candidatus Wallbacteria bacterium HGW-Wallbacteria-1 TaxID=2013854 RepID=A0A2N1PUT7_9BACT|nr:MAG: hypothetical protein CVV64_01365 [Candidatus Wallbacteria bacterium HGW-Wallbacteria-1]
MNKSNRGSTLLVILFVVSIIFILGLSYLYITGEQRYQSVKFRSNVTAFYLAEAGVARAVAEFRQELASPLVQGEDINESKLALLDIDKAATYTRVLDISDIVPGSSVHVTMQLLNVRGNPFFCFIKSKEKVPARLNIYKQTSDELYENKSLGGWSANLKILSVATFEETTRRIEVLKDVKMLNVSPPAPEYSLFISGKNVEELRNGEFLVSNWDFSDTIGSVIEPLMKEVGESFNFRGAGEDEKTQANLLNELQDFISRTNNVGLQNKINQLIMQMNPWAKVRTNGELRVYLPFFEVDDIINYFVDNRFAELPEVGYVNSNNRLHDRFMGKYTRFEGVVMKHYFEIRPYITNRDRKKERNKLYTLFSTRRRYPLQNPDEYEPEYLDVLKEKAMDFATIVLPRDQAVLKGSSSEPLRVEGLMVTKEDLRIGGPVRGKGIIYSDQGSIYVTSSLTAADKDTMISLVAPRGAIYLGVEDDVVIDGSCCSMESVLRGKRLVINGNLVVRNLNRSKGMASTSMAPEVNINYDARIRNEAVDNLQGFVSPGEISWREPKI